jgi:ABC-type branched-subunit amino acid transport system ATPase component
VQGAQAAPASAAVVSVQNGLGNEEVIAELVPHGRDISRLRPYRRARLGIARTFQSVELFGDLTVDENLLIASEHATVGPTCTRAPSTASTPRWRRRWDR